MELRRKLIRRCVIAAFAFSGFACDDGSPPYDSGMQDAASDAGGDAGSDAGTRMATVVDCSSVTPTKDIAWATTVSNVAETISVGDVVQWHVTDTFAHTVTSGTAPLPDGVFVTSITSAAPKCVRFDALGDYPFYCAIHASAGTSTTMKGTIHVQ